MDLHAKYSQILIQNGIPNQISKIETSDPNLAGEQFGSVCELVKIQFKDENKADCNLFLKKILPTQDPKQQQFFEEEVMLKEGFFLTTFVQDMKEMCFQKTGNHELGIEKLFPKTYYADVNLIVMDDLAHQGYLMLNKSEKQDFDRAKLVVESLAQFHAVSHALILRNGGLDPFTKKYPSFLNDFMTKPEVMSPMGPAYEVLLQILKASSIAGSDETYSKLVGYSGRFLDTLYEVIAKARDSKIISTNHGDCWNNNMLFKNETNSEEMKVVLLDLSNGRLGSPCLDISFYMFTSVKPKVRKQWTALLRSYFDKLIEVCQALDISPPITFKEFLIEYQKFAEYGLILGLFFAIGLDAMKDLNTKDGFFMNNLDAALNSWIQNNKEKVEHVVKNVIELVNDYLEVTSLEQK